MVRVSVVIPTYCRPEFLRKSIESVLRQTYRDFELIVVDDSSGDDTREVVRMFADPRIHFVQHKTKKGGSAARNTGIAKAQGQYIAFLDDDDEWLPEKLRLQTELIEKSPAEIGVVYTGYYQVFKDSGEFISQKTATKSGYLFHVLRYDNCVGTTSSVLLKRECLDKVGLFDENLQSSQDYDLWIRISREFQFVCINKPLVIFHVHGTRVSTNVEALQRGLMLMLNKHGIESFRLRSSAWYRTSLEIGTLWCLQNNLAKAREAYIRGIRLYPFGIRAYVGLCLSLCGVKVFKNFKQLSNWWNSVYTKPPERNRVKKKPPLRLIKELSEALNRESIRYCHWKSNEALHRSLSGDNDLDLLVNPEQRFQFSKILIQLGFKQASMPDDARYPGIFNFYGYDRDSQKVVHVHVHYRLIIGCDLLKNYELPVVGPYLETAHDLDGLKVPVVEFEYIVFVIRMVLKRRLLPWLLGHPDPRNLLQAFSPAGRPPLKSSEAREWRDFQACVKREKINDLLAKHLPVVSRELFETCERSLLQPSGRSWEWLMAGLALCTAIKPYQRYSTPLAVVLACYRRAESLLPTMSRRLPFRVSVSRKRSLVAGGRVIAFVGGDGSGKTTNLMNLQEWLGKTFDVRSFHLGIPPLCPTRLLYLVISKVIRLVMGNPQEIRVKTLHAFTQVLVARGRWKLVKAVSSAARRGVIVLCDRFPLNELKLSEGPTIPSMKDDGSPLIAWLAAIEQSYYAKIISLGLPHDIIVLRIDPQVAIDRKPEENPDFIRPRLQEIWNTNWKALRNSYVIDASHPLGNVLADVRQVVWNQLPSWSPHIEVVGHAGAGKTTVVTKLIQRGVVTSGEVTPADYPLRFIKNGMTLWWAFLSYSFAEGKWMTITKAQLELQEQGFQSLKSHIPVVYDQGPIFANAFALWLRSGRPQCHRYRIWHQRMIERSRQILDLVIWLEADSPVLRDRINSRAKTHIIKGKPDSVQNQFLASYGQYFNYVLKNDSGNKLYSCVQLRTDNISPSKLADEIAGIIA